MTAAMNHWERIRAALKSEETDRVPICLWRHWPVTDENPPALAHATIRWQQDYDFDLVKFMPTGTYGIEDWGAETTYIANTGGTRTITKLGVTELEQWPKLKKLDPTKGYLGLQIEALRLAAEGLQNSVPILQTIFSPLTTARKLAGERIFTDLRVYPDIFKEGLQIITDTTVQFALESVRAGAHGMFFASQCATYRLLNKAEYQEFGEYYDRIVLDAVRSETEFNLVHIHGEDVMFDQMAGYPTEAVNWHDRLTWPTLGQARKRFSGLLVGGLSDQETLLHGPIEAIQAEIQDAIAQTDGQGLVVGPGCVIPTHTPIAHIQAARQAVER